MASIIDDKLFELVTKSENFDFAYDISERFESIKERLWDDFWKQLQKKLKSEHNDFIIEKSSDWEFTFYNRKWKIFLFYFNLHQNFMEYGIGSLNKDYKNLFPEMIGILNEILFGYIFKNENGGFWYYSECDDDVTKLQGLKRLLPENRDQIITEYYNSFKTLLDLVIDIILKFENKK